MELFCNSSIFLNFVREYSYEIQKTIIICSACVLLLAVWAWLTWPISVSDGLKNRQLVGVSISYDIITPGVTGRDTSSKIYTNDLTKMQKVFELMNQFPINKKLLRSYPFHFVNQYMMRIMLSYKTKDKKDGVLTYLIDSDGSIMIADSGQQFHDYGTGRFGSKKCREYYQKVKTLFDQEESDPSWEK